MGNRILFRCLIFNVSAICLTFMILHFSQWDVQFHQEFSHNISTLKTLEQKVNYVLLETYFEYKKNYDSIGEINKEIDQLYQSTYRSTEKIRNPIVVSKIRSALKDFEKIFKERVVLVQDSISDFADIRISENYLPILIKELRESEKLLSQQQIDYLKESEYSLLKHSSQKFNYRLPLFPGEQYLIAKKKSFQVLNKHNITLATKLPQLHHQTHEILRLSGVSFLNSAERIENRYIDRLSEYRDTMMKILYFLSFFILLLLISLVFKVYQGKKHIEHINLTLEDTVQERTKSLAEARDRAIHLAKVKSDFVSKMSHEIRTPMNGIIGFSEILADKIKSEDQLKDLNLIRTSAQSLLIIINDILDFSRIESGKFPILNRAFSIHDLFEHLEAVNQHLKSDAVDWQVDIWSASEGEGYLGDETRIKQVLINLIGNAFKFTKEGEVKLIGEITEETEESATIKIHVKDTGIGIKKERQQAIFESFTQEDDSMARNYGGSGLGLTISASLAKLMGGHLSVSSNPGEGSTFTLSLKLKKVMFKKAERQDQKMGLGDIPWKRQPLILVAEDVKINQQLIEKILTKMKCQHLMAENGKEVIELLSQHSIDMILMDCQMPVLDGYETTKLLRNPDSPHQELPIVALSANSMKEDVERCFKVGMNDFISKPIDTKKLQKVFREQLKHLIGSS